LQVEALLEANATSVKKLESHPASLAVPSKLQRLRRHPLFKSVTEDAAAALAKHCTEAYYDPQACLLAQGAPAKTWLLPIQGTFKVFQTAATMSPAAAAAASAAVALQGMPAPSRNVVDVTSGTFHGNALGGARSSEGGHGGEESASNAPLGLEDALGCAGLLRGGGKGEGYRYAVHSPGYTHVRWGGRGHVSTPPAAAPWSLHLLHSSSLLALSIGG
jgi:hypothetical protein